MTVDPVGSPENSRKILVAEDKAELGGATTAVLFVMLIVRWCERH